ncbi:hypothetical protein Mame01_50970 [Microbispora amethystogenes]|nr:hypothetical protein Mame01_50970 [Microbispora amethystogenes]
MGGLAANRLTADFPQSEAYAFPADVLRPLIDHCEGQQALRFFDQSGGVLDESASAGMGARRGRHKQSGAVGQNTCLF